MEDNLEKDNINNSENENTENVDNSDFFDNIDNDEDFSEVLELTEYNNNMLVANNDKLTIAQYDDIKIVEISQKHKIFAKSFVGKITKFVLDFNDVDLSEGHKSYIKNVGKLQMEHLEDLLSLVDMNKQMINNIVNRVNTTQAEDYVVISSYNNLINQHLKLIKELQNTYKSIPNTLKKMKADILCNQELEETPTPTADELITENFGETHFNNGKQLNQLLAERKKLKEEKKDLPN